MGDGYMSTPVATINWVDVRSQHTRNDEVGRIVPVVLAGGLGLVVCRGAAVRHQSVPGVLAGLGCKGNDAVPAGTRQSTAPPAVTATRMRQLRLYYCSLRISFLREETPPLRSQQGHACTVTVR